MAAKKHLRFTRVRVRNWRNFRKVDVALQERVFIVGPNASGKTNLLDVFRFLRDLANPVGGGLAAAVDRRGGMKALRCLEARGRNTNIEIEVDVGTTAEPMLWTYSLAFSRVEKLLLPVIVSETISLHSEVVKAAIRQEADRPATFTQTMIEQNSQNADFEELVTFLASSSYLHVVPQIVRDMRRALDREEDVHGGHLIKRIAETPKRTMESRLRRIQAALQIAVPQFTALSLEKDSLGHPHLVAKFSHWREHPSSQNETVFSDGTLRLIGFLWSILDDGGPLLLEEPELSLHEDVVRKLPAIIARMQRNSGRQVIMTTHSEALIGGDSGVNPTEVHWLKPGDNGTEVVSAASDQSLVDQFNTGIPMSDLVRTLTRPADLDQFSMEFER